MCKGVQLSNFLDQAVSFKKINNDSEKVVEKGSYQISHHALLTKNVEFVWVISQTESLSRIKKLLCILCRCSASTL